MQGRNHPLLRDLTERRARDPVFIAFAVGPGFACRILARRAFFWAAWTLERAAVRCWELARSLDVPAP